ncbi:MAG: DMT family transporter [Dehalococcoidia bacterium]|nr:DMT family transporter [Dehalococcoidia bacterium]
MPGPGAEMTETNRTARALPVLFGLGGVWGASFLFIKVIVEETGPFELVAGRLFFGTVAVAAFMLVRRVPLGFDAPLLARLSVMALGSNVIPFALISWGEEHIDSGAASVLNSTVPIFTAVAAAAFLAEERFTRARLAGLLLGFLGVVVLTGDDIVHVTDSSVLGQLAVIAAAACYGMGAVYARTLLRSRDPVALSIWQLILGTLFTVPLLFAFSGRPDYSLSLEASLSLVALGVFGTGFGYIAYLWLIDSIGSVRASLVTYVVPAVGLFLGWLVLDEHIGVNILAGAFLIVIGVASVMRGQAPASERVAVLATAGE